MQYHDVVYMLATKFLHGVNQEDERNKRFSFARYISNHGSSMTGVKELLRAVPYLDSPYCSKCVYAPNCPYFIQDQVCLFLSKVLMGERQARPFAQRVKEVIQLMCQGSTVFTEMATDADIEVLLFLLYLATRLEADKGKQNRQLKIKAKEGRETPLGRKIRRVSETEKIEQTQREIEERWRILRLPKQPKHRDYYPKI